MKNRLTFFWNWIKHSKTNASITPSSRFLSKKMIEWIDFSTINSVIELWPGTWVFTREIVKKAKPWTKIICIEIEHSYIKILQKEFGEKIIAIKDDVRNIDDIRKEYGIDKIDLIVSWLPFNLVKTIKKIPDYTHSWTIFRGFTYKWFVFNNPSHEFPIKKIYFVPLNVPPARVYGIN